MLNMKKTSILSTVAAVAFTGSSASFAAPAVDSSSIIQTSPATMKTAPADIDIRCGQRGDGHYYIIIEGSERTCIIDFGSSVSGLVQAVTIPN